MHCLEGKIIKMTRSPLELQIPPIPRNWVYGTTRNGVGKVKNLKIG